MLAKVQPIARRMAESSPWLLLVVLLGLLVRTWWARVGYPYDLEWMEGGMLAHAWRLSRGEPLYLPPNPEFVPYIYPPGYSSLVALVSAPVGVGPVPARLLTLCGVFGAASALAYILRRRGASLATSFGVGGVFLGTYRAAGAFYDMARPDGLYVGFLGWSVALALVPHRSAAVASGLLLACSFLMKHNAAVFGVPLALALLRRDWRDGAAFAAAAMGPALGLTALFQWRSGGHFLTYLVEVPQSHPSAWWRFFPGTPLELGTALPVACAAVAALGIWRQARMGSWPQPLSTLAPAVVGAVAAWFGTLGKLQVPDVSVVAGGPGLFAATALLVVMLFRLGEMRRRPVSWEALLVGGVALVAALLAARMRAHNGGYVNVHTHMFWATTLAFGWVLTWTPRWLAGLLVTTQLLWAAVGLRGATLRPTAADRAAGDRMVEALKDREGPVLSPFAAWLPTYAGHEPSLHYMGVWDLDYAGGPMVDELSVVRKAVADGYWPTALDADQDFPYGLRKHYRVDGDPLVGDGPALRPKTGWSARPQQLRVPR